MTIFNLPTGQVKLCTLWDFMKDVKQERLAPEVREVLVQSLKEAYRPYTYQSLEHATSFTKTVHSLQQNPIKIVAELKKTTSKLNLYSKKLKLDDLLYETACMSAEELGAPTHFFCSGKGLYSFVSSEDVVLFVGSNFNQSLVCTKPTRNYTIYAPNLNMRIS
jgi:hypothetical protein